MDVMSLVKTERGADLLRQWNERAQVVSANAEAAGAPMAPEALDLSSILMQLVPIIVALLSGGFTPVALLALIPQILTILFPNLDAGLLEILKQILAFFVKP